jgi:hypothetical protein
MRLTLARSSGSNAVVLQQHDGVAGGLQGERGVLRRIDFRDRNLRVRHLLVGSNIPSRNRARDAAQRLIDVLLR